MATNIGPKIGIDGEAEYRKQINLIIQQAKTLASEMNLVTSEYTKNTDAEVKAARQSEIMQKQLDTQRERVRALSEMLEKSKRETGENSIETEKWQEVVNKAAAELNKMENELDESAEATEDLSDSIEDAEKSTFSFGDALKSNILSQAIVEGIKKIASAIRNLTQDIIRTGSGFDAAMSQVSAISGATGNEFDLLRQKALELAGSTKFTATETAEALNYMAMAGWDTESMLNGLEGIMNLAAASGEDLSQTSDIVTDALTAFGLSAEQSGRFADLLAVTASSANTNVSMMGDTFKYVAPLAGSLGFSAEDTALAIGLMANSGIKASQAGTSLRSILTRLSTDAGATSKTLGALGTLTEKLGVQFYNTDGSTRDLEEILVETREAWKGLTEEEQINYATKIAGQEAMSGWLALMNAAPNDVEALTLAIENADGAAKDMAETMQDNLSGDINRLQSAAETAKIAISEKLMPTLREFTSKALEYFSSVNWDDVGERVSSGIKTIVDNGPMIVSLVSAIGAGFATWNVVSLVTGLVNSIKAFQKANEGATIAQAALNLVMQANPIGIVITAIAALVAGLVTLFATNEEFRTSCIAVWTDVKDFVSGACTSMIAFGKSLKDNIVLFFTQSIPNAFRSFKAKAQSVFLSVAQSITELAQSIKTKAVNIGTSIIDGIQAAVQYITALPGKAMGWGRDFVQGFINGITSTIASVGDAAKGMAGKMSSYLHFSRPDVGPLRNYEQWPVHFAQGLAAGMRENAYRLADAAEYLAGEMIITPSVSPQMQGAVAGGGAAGSVFSPGAIVINVYGAEGQDVNKLADIVADKLETKIQQIEGVW